jgi:hypothetical protein
MCAETEDEALAAFGLLTRQEVGSDPRRYWRRDVDLSVCKRNLSSGTTGPPLEMLWDEPALMVDDSILVETIDTRFDASVTSIFHLVLHAGPMSRAETLAFSSPWRVVKWNLLNIWQASDYELADAIAVTAGAIVATLPSVLRLIAERLDGWHPAGIILSGETVSDFDLQLATQIAGVPPLAIYASAEFGIIGTGCPEGGYHENRAGVYLQLPEHSEPWSTMVVTTVSNLAMPLIRYDIGDRARWLPDCGCGFSGRRFDLDSNRATMPGTELSLIRERSLRRALSRFPITVEDVSRDHNRMVLRAKSGRALNSKEVRSLALALRGAVPGGGTLQLDASEHGAWPTVTVQSHDEDHTAVEHLCAWLRPLLAVHADLVFAAVVGSAVEKKFATRFSDVDVVLLCRSRPQLTDWIPTLKEARQRCSELSISCEWLDDLGGRAPLLACRLAAHNTPICGSLGALSRLLPSVDKLAQEWWQFLVSARLDLLDLASSPRLEQMSTVEVSWFVAKRALNATRFRVAASVIAGANVATIRAALSADNVIDHLQASMRDVLAVAREAAPPSMAPAEILVGRGLEFLEAEFEALETVRAKIIDPSWLPREL